MSKSLFASKTFWANALTGVVAVATALGGEAYVVAHPVIAAALVSVVAVANIYLRLITTQPIA